MCEVSPLTALLKSSHMTLVSQILSVPGTGLHLRGLDTSIRDYYPFASLDLLNFL